MADTLRILAIGGIDPSGGAGLGTDARMIQARGGTPLLVPASLTVQNSSGFHRLHPVPADLLAAMVAAAFDEAPVAAVKTGLLGTAAAVEQVAALLVDASASGVPIVVDPVLSASAGGLEADPGVIRAYLAALLPLATLATPNLPEAARLMGEGPRALLTCGVGAVLLKGGHQEGDPVEDRLLWSGGEVVLRHPRLAVGEVRGTGCALAAALACELGRGLDVETACRSAVAIMGRCLEVTSRREDGRAATLTVL